MEIETPIQEKESLIIAFDAKRLFNNYTGLGNYSRTLVKNLQEAFPEHQYHLFTPKIQKNQETAYFLDSEKFTIHTPKINHPLWRMYGMSSAVNRLKPTIFHGLSHEIPFGLHSNIQKIVSFHDLIYEKFPKQFGKWDRMMYKFKYRSSVKRANSIIAISESTKADLVEYYQIDPEKIKVIYQSCLDEYQNEDSGDSLSQVEIAGISDYYLYVGSIIERKGLLNIIFAFAGLPEEYRKPFVVVGRGDKAYVKKVKDMIGYYGLEEYFYFVKSLTNEMLIGVYDNSYALIYPSIYEGFGIPVIESLFRDIPVVTSDISSLPEAAGPGAILINPYSPDDIKNAIIQINNPEVYHRLSREGKTYVSENFSSIRTANQLMDYYHELLT